MPDLPHFSPMLSRDRLMRLGADALHQSGVETPLREARLLILHALGIDAATLIATGQAPVTATEHARFQDAIRQRAARIPYARIVRRQEFHGLLFEVSPETLIPRPDTETLVDAVLARLAEHPSPRILDLGTGTGAILAALLSARPEATGIGVDRSADAVATARANLDRIAPGRANVLQSDWFTAVTGQFDLIVSNPPYIPSSDIAALEPEVRDGDPALALDGGPDGLAAYRLIADSARAHLKPGGFVAVEFGAGQADDVRAIFNACGFETRSAFTDLGGHLRCIIFSTSIHL